MARSTADVVQSAGQGNGSGAGNGSDLGLTWH